jgi:hypothetical protein
MDAGQPLSDSRCAVVLTDDKSLKAILDQFKSIFPESWSPTLKAGFGEAYEEIPSKKEGADPDKKVLFRYQLKDVLITDKGLFELKEVFSRDEKDGPTCYHPCQRS